MSVVWECGCSKVGAGGECPECSELIATAELEGTEAEHSVIGVDILDAAELAEVLDYIAEWLIDAPPAVTASLADHGGGPEAPDILLEALARHRRALVTAVPS